MLCTTSYNGFIILCWQCFRLVCASGSPPVIEFLQCVALLYRLRSLPSLYEILCRTKRKCLLLGCSEKNTSLPNGLLNNKPVLLAPCDHRDTIRTIQLVLSCCGQELCHHLGHSTELSLCVQVGMSCLHRKGGAWSVMLGRMTCSVYYSRWEWSPTLTSFVFTAQLGQECMGKSRYLVDIHLSLSSPLQKHISGILQWVFEN